MDSSLFSFFCFHLHRFDTYRSKDESHRLAKYVNDVEEGLILAMVVNDEGSNNLEDSAKKILSRQGSQHISSLGFRWAPEILLWKFNDITCDENVDFPLWFSETKKTNIVRMKK